MRIPGAGGVQDIRIYEVAFRDAWDLIFDCLNDIGIDVDERDEEHHVVHGHKQKKYFDITLQDMGDGAVQMFFDQHKKHIEVYTWRPDYSDVDAFYKLYEQRLIELKAFIRCTRCGHKVRANTKFCPECGTKINFNEDAIDNSDEKRGLFDSIFRSEE
jgi:DNA-directed RNA polymerase subunit RPC12/RpoP